MPVTSTTRVKVICDNASCPGNSLSSTDLNGWLLLTSELYGQGSTTQHVYCSTTCASSDHEAFGPAT